MGHLLRNHFLIRDSLTASFRNRLHNAAKPMLGEDRRALVDRERALARRLLHHLHNYFPFFLPDLRHARGPASEWNENRYHLNSRRCRSHAGVLRVSLSFEFMVQNRSNRVPLVQFATASTILCPETWTKFPPLRPIEHNRPEEWIPKHTLERMWVWGHQAGRKRAVKLSPRRASVEGCFRLQACC